MSSAPGRQGPPILLTGATGYIGGRLLRVLEERGERVRCLTRRPGGRGIELVPARAPTRRL